MPAAKAKKPKLADHVARCATVLLENETKVTPGDVVAMLVHQHGPAVREHMKASQQRALLSMAKSTLRRRADAPLQQELDLGLPEAWTLAVRGEKGKVTYVLAADASEDDLMGAEGERQHRVKLAEARVANGQQSAQRALGRARDELRVFRGYVERLAGSGG